MKPVVSISRLSLFIFLFWGWFVGSGGGVWKVKLWRTYVKTDNDGFAFDILFFFVEK